MREQNIAKVDEPMIKKFKLVNFHSMSALTIFNNYMKGTLYRNIKLTNLDLYYDKKALL